MDTFCYFCIKSNVFFFQGALHTNHMKTFLLYSQWHSKNSDLLSGVSTDFVAALSL